MNILLLSNSAPNHYNFFNALALKLSDGCCNVCVSVDSKFSREQNKLDQLNFDIYEFSEYFLNHKKDKNILFKYASHNLNAALLSDFERSEVYGLWGNNTDIDYFDRLKSALLSYFEMVIISNKIDIVLYENVSNSFAHFALFVAQEHGALYCGLGASRLPGRFSITSDPLSSDDIRKVFEDICLGKLEISQELENWSATYLSSIDQIIPDYMKFNNLDRVGLWRKYFRKEKFKKIKILLKYSLESRIDAFQISNPLLTHLKLFIRNAKRRIKIVALKNRYDSPRKDEDFILYPLHFHPESSTSILSGTYLDEYEVIRNIAFNLPEGIRLYVKDHISAWGYPSKKFYRKLSRLPNIRLLAPDEPTKELIRRSKAVITLTSTVGYEALLLKKRVFLYGRVFYEFHKGVTHISNPAKLHLILSNSLRKKIDWDDSYNKKFVSAYYMSTYPGLLDFSKHDVEINYFIDSLNMFIKKFNTKNK